MLELASPLWLLGLAIVPLIRWLHRWRAPLSRVPVSALFVWQADSTESVGREIRPTPDPAWRRRALIAFLLVMALCSPFLRHQDSRVTVWIDDSLSMTAIENGRPRLADGLQELKRALDDYGTGNVTLRSLTDSTKSVDLGDSRALDTDFWLAGLPLAPDPPAPAIMSTGSAHWLVTDGASPALIGWGRNAEISNVINVGQSTENVAIVRLAARRSVENPGSTDFLVTVANRGLENARRELIVRSGAREHVIDTDVIAAGESTGIEFSSRPAGDDVEALLRPADVLAADDTLRLESTLFEKLGTLVDPACPSALVRAIDMHEGLRRDSGTGDATLQLLCSDKEPEAAHVIRFHRSTIAAVDTGAMDGMPTWLPAAGTLQNLQLRAAWINASAWPGTIQRSRDILIQGDDALVVSSGQSTVETVIDMAREEFASQPEYTAFVAGLVDLAMERPILDPIAATVRESIESDIAPRELAANSDPTSVQSPSTTGFSILLLVLAMFAIIFDLLLLWRAQTAAHHV